MDTHKGALRATDILVQTISLTALKRVPCQVFTTKEKKSTPVHPGEKDNFCSAKKQKSPNISSHFIPYLPRWTAASLRPEQPSYQCTEGRGILWHLQLEWKIGVETKSSRGYCLYKHKLPPCYTSGYVVNTANLGSFFFILSDSWISTALEKLWLWSTVTKNWQMTQAK